MTQPAAKFHSADVRAEIRANLKLALPLIAAQLAGVAMGTIDTIFAGRLGPQALAAVSVGVNFNVIFFVPFMGLLMACPPTVAHMVGAPLSARPAASPGFAARCGCCWSISAPRRRCCTSICRRKPRARR
jgi:MATE family multidrug resistance protein